MNVCFDSQIFSSHARGGIAKYFAQLTTSLPAHGCQVALPFRYSINQHYFELGGRDLTPIPHFRGSRRLCRVLNRAFPKRPARFDILHSTYYDARCLAGFDRTDRPRLITTIHDMVPELFPEYFAAEAHFNKDRYAAEADAIIVVSENTKNDVIAIYGVDRAKVFVVAHGIDLAARVEDVKRWNFGPFILFVGMRRAYKNFSRFAEAFAKFQKAHVEFSLVCVGGGAFSPEERGLMRSIGIRNAHHLEATDAQLRFLFRKAALFVYPSLYEGFGIPVIEAMAERCPIAVSDSSCLPEVARDAALYFDPLDYESICDAMTAAQRDRHATQARVQIGASIATDFTTEKMLRRTLAVYHHLLE